MASLSTIFHFQAGYPPVIIRKQDRLLYYDCLQTANEGDTRPFVRFIAHCTEKTLDVYLWATREALPKIGQEMHSTFKKRKKESELRREAMDVENESDMKSEVTDLEKENEVRREEVMNHEKHNYQEVKRIDDNNNNNIDNKGDNSDEGKVFIFNLVDDVEVNAYHEHHEPVEKTRQHYHHHILSNVEEDDIILGEDKEEAIDSLQIEDGYYEYDDDRPHLWFSGEGGGGGDMGGERYR